MTTKTEQSRRVMYHQLNIVKTFSLAPKVGRIGFDNLETALEAYLEDIRQELMQARQSIDDMQIRNHALSYAYSALQAACRASGDSLREAQELIRKQRQVIADMHAAKPQAEPVKCQHSYQYMHDAQSGDLQPRCIFCRALLEE